MKDEENVKTLDAAHCGIAFDIVLQAVALALENGERTITYDWSGFRLRSHSGQWAIFQNSLLWAKQDADALGILRNFIDCAMWIIDDEVPNNVVEIEGNNRTAKIVNLAPPRRLEE